VALTSTGAGAGNAVGALVEAMNAGTPLLHLTGRLKKPGWMPIPGLFTKPAIS
jgi:thiamine pyrophosphate-dependent acetolactate synthase large subunit-like protein